MIRAHVAALLLVVATSVPAVNLRPSAQVPYRQPPSLMERQRILAVADRHLTEQPQTITASSSPRSAGGPHDFFSEGDYWWPDPKDPDGPYIRRDGMSNPANFDDHRKALMRLSVQVPALVAAWTLTHDPRYAAKAAEHLRAWFVTPATRMNPSLRYAQAIHGVATGRGTGIIDTIHLVEVARAIEVLDGAPGWTRDDARAVHRWFTDYLAWLTTDPYGIAERDAKNNHGTCWVMQVAAFAHLTGDERLLEECRRRFKSVLVPQQMAADGSFPLEIERTKPYGYSLFNLDAMATIARVASTRADDLWGFALPDGRGMRTAMAFMAPFIRDHAKWPHPPDVMYDDAWPMRHASLLFAGLALHQAEYVELWEKLPADSDVEEVIRNFFIRQPVLWTDLAQPATPARVLVNSPNGRIQFAAWTDDAHHARYAVTLDGHPAIDDADLGIVVDRVNLTRDAEAVGVTRSSTDREYAVRGVHTRARERSANAHLELRHRASSLAFALDVRVFDDGVAFRYTVSDTTGSTARTPDEATTFVLPPGSTAWYHDLQGHYEAVHVRKAIADVGFGEWAAPPLTFKLPNGGGYGSITEGGLVGYAGMALEADGARGFHARLAHDQPLAYPFYLRYPAADTRRLSAPAAISGRIETPWRIILLGRDLNALVNADVVRHVSPAPDPSLFPEGQATSWIRPGRAVWRYLDGGDNTIDGLKTFTELAERLGFEYHVVEGTWQRWTPEELKAFVDHATAHKVKIWLWKDSRAIRDADARRGFFAQCRDLGVAGVKIDFLDHEAKEWIDYYHTLLKEAAAFHLMVDFHGANKPTGDDRAWPNELTREAVRGMENRSGETWATHNTTLPFTRYLAGPADYTPVVFGDRRRETSWAHQIATAAVFTSPLLVYGSHPQALLDNPAADVIKAIPSVWDETIVLPGSDIGELAAFARRSGDAWFVAVLNGASARTLRIDLSFLGSARYDATLVRDRPADPAAVEIETAVLTPRDALTVQLRAGGGFVAKLSRVSQVGLGR